MNHLSTHTVKGNDMWSLKEGGAQLVGLWTSEYCKTRIKY